MKTICITFALLFTAIIGNAQTSSCPDGNHPHMIDLGLPSGTLWACCNVGASKPEDYGDYYAWGETKTKTDFNWDTYAYGSSASNCKYIGSDISGTRYDVAYTKWGNSWKMPSRSQFYELVSKCTQTWTNRNGINGILVKGPNGKTMFMPAAGRRPTSNSVGEWGFYWSSVLTRDGAKGLQFYSNSWDSYVTCTQYFGHPVRAVSKTGMTSNTNSAQISSYSEQTTSASYSEQTTSTRTSKSSSSDIQSYKKCPDGNHPHMIDLGLPSGTLWACCNVGASKPKDRGGYYAWGETAEKGHYSESTYAYHYQNIGNNIKNTKYDVAHVKWGDSWCMPSFKQIAELANNCTLEYEISGISLKGKNGGELFLPFAGLMSKNGLELANLAGGFGCGFFWTSSLSSEGRWIEHSHSLFIHERLIRAQDIRDRYNGLSVRAVSQKGMTMTQIESMNQYEDDVIYNSVKDEPLFPGGSIALKEYIDKNQRYPASAAENGIPVNVTLSFVIEKDGSTSNIEVIKYQIEDLNKEAIRLIKEMPKWKPGMLDGKPVRVKYILPIKIKF